MNKKDIKRSILPCFFSTIINWYILYGGSRKPNSK